MRCSVVILNWNGGNWLKQFLPIVVNYTSISDCEIVVADNGSTDNSVEIIRQYPHVRLISFNMNYGFAEGYNRALQHIDAEYSILLNSDIEVTSDWLLPLLRYMDSHPEVAACQPKILSWKDKKQFEHAGAAGGYIDALGYPYCRGRILNYIEEDKGQYDYITEVFWATGACLMIRTDIYKKCGGFDDGFFAHMEEIDLCWRLQCRGYKIVCVPQSIVYHVGGGTLDYENPRKTYLNFRNNLLMLYKNLPITRLFSIMFFRFWLDYLALFQNLLKGRFKNVKAIFAARLSYHELKSKYKPIRKENISSAIIPYPTSISHRSIIFDYYILGKRK